MSLSQELIQYLIFKGFFSIYFNFSHQDCYLQVKFQVHCLFVSLFV